MRRNDLKKMHLKLRIVNLDSIYDSFERTKKKNCASSIILQAKKDAMGMVRQEC